jgi:hypothetical protein
VSSLDAKMTTQESRRSRVRQGVSALLLLALLRPSSCLLSLPLSAPHTAAATRSVCHGCCYMAGGPASGQRRFVPGQKGPQLRPNPGRPSTSPGSAKVNSRCLANRLLYIQADDLIFLHINCGAASATLASSEIIFLLSMQLC